MALAPKEQFARLGMAYPLAEKVGDAITAAAGPSLPISAGDVTVGAITADEFTFAGGTLAEFCQAIADAIPPSA